MHFYLNLVMLSDEIRNLVLTRRFLSESIRQIAKNLQLKKCSVETKISYKKKVIKQKRGPKMKIIIIHLLISEIGLNSQILFKQIHLFLINE